MPSRWNNVECRRFQEFLKTFSQHVLALWKRFLAFLETSTWQVRYDNGELTMPTHITHSAYYNTPRPPYEILPTDKWGLGVDPSLIYDNNPRHPGPILWYCICEKAYNYMLCDCDIIMVLILNLEGDKMLKCFWYYNNI